MLATLKNTRLQPSERLNDALKSRGSATIREAQAAWQLLKRPELHLEDLKPFIAILSNQADETIKNAEIELKYSGYIARQQEEIDRCASLEDTPIPPDFSFFDLEGITIEAREKLSRIRPSSLGQASRIAGVSPADISVLSIFLRAFR